MSPNRFAMRYAEWQVVTGRAPDAVHLSPSETTCQTGILGLDSRRVTGLGRLAHTFYIYTCLAFHCENALTCHQGVGHPHKTPSTTTYRRVTGAVTGRRGAYTPNARRLEA